MITNTSKKLTQFYQFSLVFIILSTLGVLFYFWKMGFIDGSRGKELYQASYIVDTYENKDILGEVKNLVWSENSKLALEKLNRIEKELGGVNAQITVKSYSVFKDDLQKLKTSIANLISFSKVDNVVDVFRDKMDKFYVYVQQNQWRTLTRMSDRIFSQISGHIGKEQIKTLTKSIERDFETMLKVTNNSILSRADKAEISSRISHLMIEIEMLKKYIDERSFFEQLFNQTKKSKKKWTSDLTPELTIQKLEIDQMGKYYLFGLLALTGVGTILFSLGLLYTTHQNKKAKVQFEDFVQEMINENILEDKPFQSNEYSHEFESYIHNISHYIQKRMSFGSIFQDAMPFSSILLDHNLKVQWANKQFCEDWLIDEDEMKKDYMTWDFLSKLTNLGHDDPVLEALKHGVAGIYQVKTKPNDNSMTRAFEMFVAPVKYQNEKKVMLFFYDLSNLEQTIQDQAVSIVSPVRRSLEQLLNNTMLNEENDLSYEFSIAGIEDINSSFLELAKRTENERQSVASEINTLQAQIQELTNHQDYLYEQLNLQFGLSQDGAGVLKTFKDNVIGLSELSHKLSGQLTKAQEIIYTNINALNVSSEKINSSRNMALEVVELLPKFETVKEELRHYKALVYEHKVKISTDLITLKASMQKNRSDMSDRVYHNYEQICDRYNKLELNLDESDKRVSQLELLISKLGMLGTASSEKLKEMNTEYEAHQILVSGQEAKQLQRATQEASQIIEQSEVEIVDNLKVLFGSTKSSLQMAKSIKAKTNSLQ